MLAWLRGASPPQQVSSPNIDPNDAFDAVDANDTNDPMIPFLGAPKSSLKVARPRHFEVQVGSLHF